MKNLKFRAYDPEGGMIYQSNLIKFHISGNGMWIVSDHAGKALPDAEREKLCNSPALKTGTGKRFMEEIFLKTKR